MVFVKICGIMKLSPLQACVKYGADAVGFVVGVPESPRNLTEFQAHDLINVVAQSIRTVVVTSVYSCQEVEYLAARFPESYIQVHFRCRNPRFEDLYTLNLERIIPAINASQTATINPDLPSFQKILLRIPYLLIDGSAGTGRKEDIPLVVNAVKYIHPCKVVLAGGLNPNNLLRVLEDVRPYGVDVSSGVEQAPGIKSIERIKQFLAIAKNFDGAQISNEENNPNKPNLIQKEMKNYG